MNTATKRGAIFALMAGAFLSGPLAAANPEPRVVQVNCSSGETLAQALKRGKEDRPLLVLVQGVCNETVAIERADVTLRGEAGAAINGPDPALDTITVRADRVSIENLLVSGGQNGIFTIGAGNFAARGVTVQSTGRTGIFIAAGSGALIDGCTSRHNPRDGVSSESAQMTVTNSTVTHNARFGIFVGPGVMARIGVDNAANAAGNMISLNGGSGVSMSGATAIIGNNSIMQNGTDSALPTRTGITVSQSTADIPGGNTIANNAGQGVFVTRGSVQIGGTSFNFPSTNTITGNGNPAQAGGVSGFLAASIVIRDATISGNQGYGVILSMRSQAQIFNSRIQNNVAAGTSPGDGIRLVLGSSLLPTAPASVVTGNAGAGLSCFGDSAAVSPFLLGSAGNGLPDTVCNPF
jgi:hypothetical protein